MKFLDYLFPGKELRYIDSYFKMLNGYSPTFTSYNGGVYEMDLTRTAVNSFATHCSKLKPEIEGSALKSLEKTLQHKPNYFMDTTKFIKRLATYVAVEHTAFIIPIEDEYGRLCGWYPLRAQRCEVVEAAGQVYLRYLFANGEHGAIEFERVGIMTDFEYTDDLFGEDNRTLKPTMQLIHTQNEGIINAVKNSANIRFLAKVANMLKPEDIKKERQRFTEDNLTADNDSGMIIYDNKFSELKQVESKPYTPNALQMQNIQENVCTHFGTNMDILQNKFDENTWNAYYEGKIEPFAIKRKAGFMNMTITEFIEAAAHNKIIQLVVLAIVCDTVFGVLRAIKEKKFNSCAGIDGAIRKVGMLISLVFMLAIDVLIKINLIGFIPEQARTYLGLDTVGVAEFFALLYIAYEVVSIFKNMALCGLPVKKVWEKVREFLAKYTDELPDTDELDGDSTTGNVEEHRTQER